MRIIVDQEHDGVLLRTYLKGHLKLSTKMLSRLKNDAEGIVLNGTRVTVRAVLHTGDILELMDADRYAGNAIASDLPVEIVYEDEDVVAVAKPPDMPTHPSHGHLDDTLANALIYHYKKQGIPFVFRPISRLDRNTSGVVPVAKHQIAAGRLDAAMKECRIHKTYLAILSGTLPEKEGRIETYMCRVDGSLITRRVCEEMDAGAMRAVTTYTVLAEENGMTMVLVHPLTGRTHQLRVHFSFLGAPILGDDLYGEGSAWIKRQALHAVEVTFPHPKDGRECTVMAPLPSDMRDVIQQSFSAENVEKVRKFIRN